MRFIKNLCITCLAELIKLACPWYLKQLLYRTMYQVLLVLVFLFFVAFPVFFPRFVDNALHQVSLPQEFFESDRQTKMKSPPDMSFTKMKSQPDMSFIETEFKKNFPLPKELTLHVEFWKNIFSRYTGQQAVIHDDWYFLVYAVVEPGKSPGLHATIRKYKRILLALDRKERIRKLDSLTPEEAKVYKMFEHISEKNKFKKAAYERIRVQYGQRGHFIKAIQRSGLYQQQFEQIFKKYGLPIELTRIPFVESYFKYSAYSYAGAAGVWQFIPSTARLYGLKMNYKVDERYDPFKAADSAARLLKANYEIFGSWPLAVTAYHHGSVGIQKAIKQLKTKDLGKIVREYRGSKFRFYSRNYYAQFLATVQVMQDPEKHIGTMIELLPPLRYEQVIVKRPIFLKDIVSKLSISNETLVTLNRDLKHAVVRSKSPLPKNYVLKIPPGRKQQFLAQIAGSR